MCVWNVRILYIISYCFPLTVGPRNSNKDSAVFPPKCYHFLANGQPLVEIWQSWTLYNLNWTNCMCMKRSFKVLKATEDRGVVKVCHPLLKTIAIKHHRFYGCLGLQRKNVTLISKCKRRRRRSGRASIQICIYPNMQYYCFRLFPFSCTSWCKKYIQTHEYSFKYVRQQQLSTPSL